MIAALHKAAAVALLALLLALPATAGDRQVTVGGLDFAVPPGWVVAAPDSPMRKAELRVPGALGGPEGLVTFFHFGAGQGGSAADNIARWERQFTEAPAETGARTEVETIGGRQVHWFRAAGTYLAGMPGGPRAPRPDHALLGAVLEGPEGNVFVRLVAPRSLADHAGPAWRRMIAGALGG
jgi:hypothetical protein